MSILLAEPLGWIRRHLPRLRISLFVLNAPEGGGGGDEHDESDSDAAARTRCRRDLRARFGLPPPPSRALVRRQRGGVVFVYFGQHLKLDELTFERWGLAPAHHPRPPTLALTLGPRRRPSPSPLTLAPPSSPSPSA